MTARVALLATAGNEHLLVYRGVPCSQHPAVLKALDALHGATADAPFARIVEIGTYKGGFTCVLRDHDVSAAAQITSFDIEDRATRFDGISYKVGDVLGDAGEEVRALVRAEGRVALFCDGGAKSVEVASFCGVLKPGDVILCHDYAASDETRDGDGWPKYEVRRPHIAPALSAAMCEDFLPEIMGPAVWGCFIRRAVEAGASAYGNLRSEWVGPPPLSDKLADWHALAMVGGEALTRDRDVLDVGPAFAVDAMLLSPYAKSYTVIDSQVAVLAQACRVGTRIIARRGDITQRWPFDGASFDTIIDFSTFDDTADPVHCYCEAARVLRPSGVLLTSYANAIIPEAVRAVAGYKTQSPNDLRRMLEAVGFMPGMRGFTEDKPRATLIAIKGP